MRVVFVAAALWLWAAPGSWAQSATFLASDGLVVVEAETLGPARNWVDTTAIAGFTGAGYLLYEGPDRFNLPGRPDVLRFNVAVETAGTYRIQWRSRIAVGNENTEHNDSWLRLRDAADFFAQVGSRIVYPRGTGRTPNPEGSSADGWFKVYQNQVGRWSWQTRTSDNDPHDVYARFDTAGTYLVEISGRSNGHAIDRIVLYHSEVDGGFARDLARPESERQTVGVGAAARAPDTLFPNPADGVVTVRATGFAEAPPTRFEAIDVTGRRHALPSPTRLSAEAYRLDVGALPPGSYVLRVETNTGTFTQTFTKR